MEFRLEIKDVQPREITALSYIPWRREVVTGGRKGLVTTNDAESGEQQWRLSEHRGYVQLRGLLR